MNNFWKCLANHPPILKRTRESLKDVMVPANSSLRALSAGEKLILAPSNTLLVQADQDDSLDAVISYVDIV